MLATSAGMTGRFLATVHGSAARSQTPTHSRGCRPPRPGLFYGTPLPARSPVARSQGTVDARDCRTTHDVAADSNRGRSCDACGRRHGAALGELRRHGILRDDPGGSRRLLRLTAYRSWTVE